MGIRDDDIRNAFDKAAMEARDPRFSSVTCLYRYFYEGGGLIYIGIADDMKKRDEQHFRKSPWRLDARSMRIEAFPTRAIAELAEVIAIANERPPYNKQTYGSDCAKSMEFPKSAQWYTGKNGAGIQPAGTRWAEMAEFSGSWNMPRLIS